MIALLWLAVLAALILAARWWRSRSALLPTRSPDVVDLAEARRLRALARAVDRHPSGRAS